ncbi:MAG TPA: serine hydrolase domain-containing protein [Gemmatimonadales bacterium]|nr:serine hydrolase domain-containing protein [Gemmatimonadales bacterium]
MGTPARVQWARSVVTLLAAAWLAIFVQAGFAAQPQAGLWIAKLDLGPEVRGELRVTRNHGVWQADIAGRLASVAVDGDSVRFQLPHGLGEFRGTWGAGRASISGFWIQPPGAPLDPRDPGSADPAYASPLVLRRSGPDRWGGDVVPLDHRFTLYLDIERSTAGAWVAAFRNPERNSTGGASLFQVTRVGDSLWFGARPDTSEPAIRIGAAFDRSSGGLRIDWPDLGRSLDMRRCRPAEAAAFHPRAARDTAYVYRAPRATGDGWRTARAREVGMDETVLARLVQRLLRVDPSRPRPPLVHSLLVARRGKLVLEEYFHGYDRERPHDLRSAGKTFASVMLGAAMMRGVPIGPDSSIYRLVAARGPFANPDPRKADVTLAQLMTHTSGLACDDNDDRSPGNEAVMQRQRQQPDWWKYTLDLPMVHDPGTRYAYASAGMNLVGAALTTTTRTWLPAWFERTIARPLQFGRHYWNVMPNGEGYLGGGAFVRPRDLLKLGQVYLDDGQWRGTRIVDSSWVTRSTAARVHISPTTTGLSPDEFGNFYLEADDGLAWHLSQLHANGREYRSYGATGNGGQLLIVVPELQLVVVFTAGNYSQGGIWLRFRSEIVPREIIPAIVD